jgi:hypothetical protein
VGVVYEKAPALAIAVRCIDAARRQGWAPGFSRTTDTFISLSQRCAMANDNGADAFVSIHSDWVGAEGDGFKAIYRSTQGHRLSDALMRELDPLTVYKDVGVYADRRGLAVLRGTNTPATVVEVLSVAEPILTHEDFLTDVAEQIVEGLCRFYGEPYIGRGEDVKLDCLWVIVPGSDANLATVEKHAAEIGGNGLWCAEITPGTRWVHVRQGAKARAFLAKLDSYRAFKGKVQTMPTYVGSFADIQVQ